MTRKQAERIAAEIVKRARSAGSPEAATWVRVAFPISAQESEKISEGFGIVSGCLPIGWRIRLIGDTALIVSRPEA